MVAKHFTNRKVLCWSGVLAAVVDQENMRFISFFALKSAIVQGWYSKFVYMLMRRIFKKTVKNIFCVTQKYCMPLFASTESPPSFILNGGFDKKVTKITVV